jgi:hypothetical protein
MPSVRRLRNRQRIMLVCVTAAALAASPSHAVLLAQNTEVTRTLLHFGTSNVDFLMSMADSSTGESITGNAEAKATADRMMNGYRRAMQSRKAVDLLDSSFEIILVGTDVYTAGSSLVATVPIRWLKNKGMEAIRDKAGRDAVAVLASQVNRFGRNQYEQLQNAPPEKIKAALNQLGVLNEINARVGNDPRAKALVETAITDALVNTQRATLDELSRQQGDIERVKNDLSTFGRQMSTYVESTTTALNTLGAQMSEVQTSLAAAQADIDDLKQTAAHTTQQLGAINEVLFSRGTASEKLILIKGGALSALTPADQARVTRLVEADAKKERLVSQVNSVLNEFNKIGGIARALGAPPEIGDAITFANAAASVFTDIVSGDILGAIGGITGLFGSRPDPAAERHRQLMSFLQTEFDRVNQKLDQLIQGQQKIVEAIVALSEQMAEYDRVLHTRLDRIEFRLDTVERTTRAILNAPLTRCVTAQSQIATALASELKTSGLDLSKPRQVQIVAANVAPNQTIFPCIATLEDLFNSVDAPVELKYEPLVIRYTDQLPNGVGREVRSKYFATDIVQKFYEQLYSPTWNFFQIGAASIGLGPATAALSLPVGTARDVVRKHETFAKRKDQKLCAVGSPLSDPWVALLCKGDNEVAPTPSLLTLPQNSLSHAEEDARRMLVRLMEAPLAHDSILRFVRWAQTLAPLYNFADARTERLVPDVAAILATPDVKPKAPRLLQGAMRVTTLSLAQTNLLYGDTTAKMVFDELWNAKEKQFRDSSEGRALAASRLLYNNAYLQRNVLMLALHSSFRLEGNGEFSYAHALDLLESTALPDSQLRTLFGDGLSYQIRWQPTAADAAAEEVARCQKNIDKKGCEPKKFVRVRAYLPDWESLPANAPTGSKHPYAYDLEIPLPLPAQFAQRQLVYPPTLIELAAARDQLAAQLADYDVFDWAEASTKVPGGDLAASLLAIVKEGKEQ